MKNTDIRSTRDRRMKYVIYTLFSLVAADGVISQFLIRCGLGYEGNPFLQTLIGEENFLLIKSLGAFLGTLMLWEIYKNHPKEAFKTSILLMVMYMGIVFWNLGVFFST